MAEFCPKCWGELNGVFTRERDYVLSRPPELCEGCGEYKRVIVVPRRKGLLYWMFEVLKPEK